MGTNTEKIVVQVVVQGDKQLGNLEKKTKSTTASFGKMTAGIIGASAAFQQMSKLISGAIRTFKSFEFEMAKVKAITGSTEKDFKKLTNTAQQLGRTTFFTASQVAELQVAYGKLGFSTTEILAAQEATLQLATATQSDLGRAAVVAGAAVRGFGLDASETQRVVDVMAVAFTSSALDIEKFQTSMTKVAPIAAAASISIEATSAVMGTLTDAGIEASIAGTSLRNIFLKMQDPASDLSKHLGFTVENTADLEKALTQLNNEGLSNAEMMELVDLRQVAAFQTMINGADSVLDLTDALEDANGEAQKMADIMADTLEGDLLKVKSAWEGLEIAIFSGSSNISRYLRTVVSDFTQFLNVVVANMRTEEQLGADFLTESLKNVKNVQDEINDLQKSGEPVASKSRAELLDVEIEKLKSLQYAQKLVLKDQEKIGEGIGAVAAKGRENAEDYKKQINARKLAIKDLEEILEGEIKAEGNKNDRIQLEKDIQSEKDKRRREKEERDKEIEKEKEERERLAKEQQNYQDSQNQLKIALQEELNADKENLINGEITQAEYDLRAFEAEQAHLENMKNLNIAYGKDIADINGQILDNELDRIKTVAQKTKEQQDSEIDTKLANLDIMKTASGAMFDIMEQNANRALDQERKRLEEQKESGVISQEEYEEEVEKVQRKAFKQKKKRDSMEVIMNTAMAVAKVFAQTGIFGFAAVAPIIAVGAAQLALIQNQKYALGGMIDEFAKGGMIEEFANGGMVNGKSHAQGGEKFAVGGRVVELEGGEAVINKRSTAMFRNQLSAMNSAGGGVKFADGGLLNMPSFSQQQFNALGQNQMMGAMGGASKVVVVEADITSTQNSVSVIESDAII